MTKIWLYISVKHWYQLSMLRMVRGKCYSSFAKLFFLQRHGKLVVQCVSKQQHQRTPLSLGRIKKMHRLPSVIYTWNFSPPFRQIQYRGKKLWSGWWRKITGQNSLKRGISMTQKGSVKTLWWERFLFAKNDAGIKETPNKLWKCQRRENDEV